ncbi:MAG: DUF4440 domain-containing protein [Leptospiraceae bacterium]|nr:DUF4440 domain-containing protein [Leptospiraceae bacterium]
MNDTEKLIRESFKAWQNDDRESIESIVAQDFTFTSPYDDRIDRPEFFKRCWSHSNKIDSFSILSLITQGNEGFARYRCYLKSGQDFENTEYFETNGKQITKVIVFFGALPGST